jgi:hypothetical protein
MSRYALPASTEHKLAELRRSQGICHRLGPEKGQSQLPKKSYQRVRVQRGLDIVLTTEAEPATTPAPAAELRILTQLGLVTLQNRLQAAVRTISPVSPAERIRKGARCKTLDAQPSAKELRR